MTQDKLLELATSYAGLLAQASEIKKEMDDIKVQLKPELDAGGSIKYDFGDLRATLQKRKGSVDMKALQVRYSLMDSDIDALRKPSIKTWVFTRIKK